MPKAAAAFLIAAFIAAGRPVKAETPLFPQSHITYEQWQHLLDSIEANPDRHLIARPDLANVIVIEIAAEKSVYYFAKAGPAYPAVAIAHLVNADGHVYLEKRGYFAGDEADFASWFKALTVQPTDLPDAGETEPPPRPPPGK